ncbi:hypothetical protein BAN20980_04660 [Burkholderia anthina]|uniref:Uncharacterized protein n=1 Tax=Burkholderia anthina TaxID=179879 RepID=A0A6P2GEE1_9BURK|nr:hypothetical protein BAN20980_04660 [Burkholderia anthina]
MLYVGPVTLPVAGSYDAPPPITEAMLSPWLFTVWFVWYNCEPFTASVLVADTSPAATFVIFWFAMSRPEPDSTGPPLSIPTLANVGVSLVAIEIFEPSCVREMFLSPSTVIASPGLIAVTDVPLALPLVVTFQP